MSQFFNAEFVENGILKIVFHHPDSPDHLLDEAVLKDLELLTSDLVSNSQIRGAFVMSQRDGVFSRGKDYFQLLDVSVAEKGYEISREGQQLFQKWSELPFPTLAVLEGDCLGAGLEWALSFTYRVIADHPESQLALPQIKLGLMPGWGGSVRLPSLIGLKNSLDMILSGEVITANQAQKIGLVDDVIPPWQLDNSAIHLLNQALADKGAEIKRRRKKIVSKRDYLDKSIFGRSQISRVLKSHLEKSMPAQYPAPYEAMRSVLFAASHPLEDGLAFEARKFAVLCSAPVTQQLIWQHIVKSAMQDQGETSLVQSAEQIKIGVAGSGRYGRQIANRVADIGHPVRLKDITYHPLALAVAKNKHPLSGMSTPTLQNLISPTISYSGFSRAGYVFEAVSEDLDLKKAVLAELERRLSNSAYLISTSATGSAANLAETLDRPAQFLVMRLFRMNSRDGLVEYSLHHEAEREVAKEIHQLIVNWGMVPLQVADRPGGLVNRLLCIYFREALALAEQGVEYTEIDLAMKKFGITLGPFELMDYWGLRNVLQLLNQLNPITRASNVVADLLVEVLGLGNVGMSSGEGFYSYQQNKPKPNTALMRKLSAKFTRTTNRKDILERLLFPMIDQAISALAEKLVEKPAQIDGATIFGMGFPGFRGGLLRYAEAVGVEKITGRLFYFSEIENPRFTPSPALLAVQESGKSIQNYFKNKG